MRKGSAIMEKAYNRILVWLGIVSAIAAAHAASGVTFYTVETDEPEPAKPEISVTYGYPDLNAEDNPVQFAESSRIKDDDMGGIELFWQNDIYADWRVIIDGQLFDNPEQYKLRYQLFKPESFYFTVDFTRWMKYDNGDGIYYPPQDAYFTLSDEALEETITRLLVSIEGMPSFEVNWKVEYSLLERDGQSLSTRFGDDLQYAIGANSTRPRKIVPALVEGEESVHTVDARLARNDGGNRTGLRLHFQRRESDRSRITERAASQPSANRYTTQKETTKDDIFAFSAFTRRQMTDSILGSVGLAMTRLDGEITGSRIFGANPEAEYDIDFAAYQLNDRGFLDLEGSRNIEQLIINGNLVYAPYGSNYRWMAGIRLEQLSTEAFGSYIDTIKRVDFGDLETQRQEADMLTNSEKTATDLSGFLELRYKGISKALLYSRVEAAAQTGSLDEDWDRMEIIPNPGQSPRNLLDRATNFDRERLFWEAGVNYYPARRLRFSLEGYLKVQDNSYDYNASLLSEDNSGLYPGYLTQQKMETRDVNARIHWRIFDNLKSVTRVDAQYNEIDTATRLSEEMQSSERERILFNQSLTWNPHPKLFVTAAYMLSDDLLETGAADIEGPYSGIIVNLPNDYWQADLNLYYVLSKRVDVQLGYHYLEMSNYIDTSPKTVPYGTDIEQHHGNLRFILHFSEALTARIGYQYYEQTDGSAPGLRDYTVHVISGGAQYRF